MVQFTFFHARQRADSPFERAVELKVPPGMRFELTNRGTNVHPYPHQRTKKLAAQLALARVLDSLQHSKRDQSNPLAWFPNLFQSEGLDSSWVGNALSAGTEIRMYFVQ